jgi:hypothetical protein
VILALLLLAGSMLAVGCGPPPDIAEEDVVGFAIGFDPGIYIDSSLPSPPESLGRFITAYNASGSARWDFDTTPPLFAMLELADATRITIWFSPLYPEDCAAVLLRDPDTGESRDYRVKSPDLLPAVWELTSELDKEQLRTDYDNRSWLPE